MSVIYNALFVDNEERKKLLTIGSKHLSKIIAEPHVTLHFRPTAENTYSNLWGGKATLKVVGYANDGKNEGVLVKVKAEDPLLQVLFDSVKTPHITISVSDDGKPVDTAKLDFQLCDPITVKATFGAFVSTGHLNCERGE